MSTYYIASCASNGVVSDAAVILMSDELLQDSVELLNTIDDVVNENNWWNSRAIIVSDSSKNPILWIEEDDIFNL